MALIHKGQAGSRDAPPRADASPVPSTYTIYATIHHESLLCQRSWCPTSQTLEIPPQNNDSFLSRQHNGRVISASDTNCAPWSSALIVLPTRDAIRGSAAPMGSVLVGRLDSE